MKPLFDLFDGHIRKSGFEAKKGQIVDAPIVKVPIQRNKRDKNRKIKDGEPPEDWPDDKRSQKDTDTRWTRNEATDRRSNEKDTEANPSRGGKDRVTEQEPKSEAEWSTYSEPKS